MTLKDDGDKTISKNVLDWLNQVGGLISTISGIAAALAAIFGLLFPSLGEDAQRITLGVAGVLAVGSGTVYFYRYRRAAKLKIAESLEPLSATAALRGLLPFEEGDQLPGRARDVQELYTLVTSSSFRFGVLWGESGCGKTSLLRAGLTSKLRNEKFLPLYISRPTKDPQEAIRLALLKEIQVGEKRSEKNLKTLLKTAAPKGKKILVLFDQFEEFFLTNRTPGSRTGFVKWLGEVVADETLPIAFLIGIRADFFAQLQNFAPQIPEPTSIRTTYQLQNFDTEQAKQIFNSAAKADGIPFEPELIRVVIRELEAEEFVRPAELQVVGTRLKRKNITRLNQYEAHGGARRILSSYISDEIKQSQNEYTARLVLRLMCADVVETKSQTDLSLNDILNGVSGIERAGDGKAFGRPEEIEAILKQFVTARVIIHTDDDKYNLVHDYLAPYVRTATEGIETNIERANRLLKRYVAEYKEDPKTRIPFGRLHLIQKFASPDVISKDKVQELIWKSKRVLYALTAAFALPVVVLIGFYFFYLTQSYYFSIDNSYIVLRAGAPQFTFLPGFGEVVIQTDYKRNDLKDDLTRDEIDQGRVQGFWFQEVDLVNGSYQLWGEQLAVRLEPISQARAFRLLGDPHRAGNILINILVDPKADSTLRANAANALSSLAQVKPQVVTSSMLQATIDVIMDPNAESFYDSPLPYEAIACLEILAQSQPQAVTDDMVQDTMDTILDSKADFSAYSNAVSVLGPVASTRPEAVTSDMLQDVMDIITNQDEVISNDYYWQANVVSTLEQLIQNKPEFVTDGMFQAMIYILDDPQVENRNSFSDYHTLAREALSTLGSLAEAQPQKVTPHMIEIVRKTLQNPYLDEYAEDTLISLTIDQDKVVTPALLQELLQESIQHGGASFSSTVDSSVNFVPTYDSPPAFRLRLLAYIQPEAVTADLFQATMEIVTDPNRDSTARSNAVSILGALAEVKPEEVTSDMAQAVVDILIDPDADFSDESGDHLLLFNSMSTLGSLARAKPQEIDPHMMQTLLNIATNPKTEPTLQYPAVFAMGALAEAQHQNITPDLLQELKNIIANQNNEPNLRYYALVDLALLIEPNPSLLSSEEIQSRISLLEADLNSSVRQETVRRLFIVAVRLPKFQNKIKAEFEELATSDQPHLRMTGLRGLELMTIGDMLEEAQAHPDQIAQIKSKLDRYLYQEEDFHFAAFVVLHEIYKIEHTAR